MKQGKIQEENKKKFNRLEKHKKYEVGDLIAIQKKKKQFSSVLKLREKYHGSYRDTINVL